MVIPQLTHLGWDSADDLASLVYDEGEPFEVYLTATVSDRPGHGGDNFGLTVISPKKLCHSCPGVDWSAAATKLSHYMHWEFENYREYDPRK